MGIIKPTYTNGDFKWLRKAIQFLKTIHLPYHNKIPVYKIVIAIYKQIQRVGIAERASILSFNIMMAIPPSLMFIFAVTPYLPFLSDKFHKEILLVIKEMAPDKATFQNLSIIINDLFYKPKNAVYSLSFFLFLFFSSNATLVMMKTFNKSIEYKRKLNFIVTRIIAIVLTLSLFAIFIALIALLNVEKYLILKMIRDFHLTSIKTKNIIVNFRVILSALFLFISIAFIYRFTPSLPNKKWRFFSPGALIASVFILVMLLAFNYWASNFLRYNKTYGPLGTLIFVMTLIYIFSFLLLVGFEINLSIDQVKKVVEQEQDDKKAKGEL